MTDVIPLWIICIIFIPLGILFFIGILHALVGLMFSLFDDNVEPKKQKTMGDKSNKETHNSKSSKTGWGGIPKGKKKEWWQ